MTSRRRSQRSSVTKLTTLNLNDIDFDDENKGSDYEVSSGLKKENNINVSNQTTENTPNEIPSSTTTNSQERKKFPCGLCDKSYTQGHNLKKHVEAHHSHIIFGHQKTPVKSGDGGHPEGAKKRKLESTDDNDGSNESFNSPPDDEGDKSKRKRNASQENEISSTTSSIYDKVEMELEAMFSDEDPGLVTSEKTVSSGKMKESPAPLSKKRKTDGKMEENKNSPQENVKNLTPEKDGQTATSSPKTIETTSGGTKSKGKAKRRFSCELCDKSYTQSHSLKEHERNIHGAPGPAKRKSKSSDSPREFTSYLNLIDKPQAF